MADETLKFEVAHSGRLIGVGFVSRDPSRAASRVATIVPLERTGEWDRGTLELNFVKPVHGTFPQSHSDGRVVDELLALAHIEPEKVTIHWVPVIGRPKP